MANGRRGHGEGSIFRRADGYWTASVDLGRREGKRCRKTIYGKTRREVSDKLKAILRDQQLGTLPTGPNVKLGVYLERWLEDVARRKVRPMTFKSYSGLLRVHVIPELGDRSLEKLSVADVRGLLNRKSDSRLSLRTVHHIRAVLRTALAAAVRDGMVPRNVAALAGAPQVPDHEMKVLEPEQAGRLLEVVKGDRLEALYTVALSLGLRQGEALGLRWEDIDLDGGTLTVSYALQRIDGEYRLVRPKTKKSEGRVIALPDRTLAALREHKIRHRKEQLASKVWVGTEHDLVFTDDHGLPLSGTDLTKRFKRLLKSAGLPEIRFHDLRHSCATLLLVQGIPAKVVADILGHSTVNLTLNTYSHVVPALRREAAAAMDRALGG